MNQILSHDSIETAEEKDCYKQIEPVLCPQEIGPFVCRSISFFEHIRQRNPSHKNGDENEKATTFTRLSPIFTMEVFLLMHK